MLNADYYCDSRASNSYHIPISMHPNKYQGNITDGLIEKDRINAVFFAGNLNRTSYNNSSNEEYFNIENRIILTNQVHEKYIPTSKMDYYNSTHNHKVIIINTESFFLDHNEYFEALSTFSFFLACPGIIKPTSHNIVEALFCGAIPIIQKEYADLMKPPLKHLKTCFIFEKGMVNDGIEQALNSSAEVREGIKANILSYYQDHLSIDAVIRNVTNSQHDHFYLEAEEESMNLLK